MAKKARQPEASEAEQQALANAKARRFAPGEFPRMVYRNQDPSDNTIVADPVELVEAQKAGYGDLPD